MKEDGYKIRDQFGVHFITFAVVQWVDVFSRYCYAETVLNSLSFCIKEKGLKVHAWCIMSNHVHLIVSAEKGNLSDILRCTLHGDYEVKRTKIRTFYARQKA